MTKSKILYVDDEEINLQLFAAVLKDRFEVMTAPDGSKGLELLEQNPDIHVVITDMNMPIMTGIEFIVKARKINQSISYYILTGYEISKEIEEALEGGLIKKYFKKPFNPLEIGAMISS